MLTHELLQGSPAWNDYRASHLNASDAPAMLGLSKYKTRTELLNERKTGLTADVSGATQKLFDNGHKFEALARPLAEKIIGDDLYPVTGSLGKFSASFDGLNLSETIAFEHKTLNSTLMLIGSNADLDEMYLVQMEQQLLVSGAEKCLFMASKWDEADELIEEVHIWYFANVERRQRIVDGWAQFEKDLATYVPPVIVEKVEAETIQTLPVPSVVVRGEITTSNLGAITPLFDNYLGAIKTELSTDQDFADAEANAKNCRETAKRIQALRVNIIAQMVDINTIDGTLGNYEEAFDKVGLRLEKAVKEQKEAIKNIAILTSKQTYTDHVQALEVEITPIRLILAPPDFAGAIKGIKTIASMHSRLNDALASGKIDADAMARDIRVKLVWFNNYTHYKFLFSDLHSIINKPLDDFMLLVVSRVESHKDAELARELAITERAEADTRAKLEREEQAKTKIDADHIATADKIVNQQEPLGAMDLSSGVGRIAAGEGHLTSTVTHFQGVEPSVADLVNAISKAFGADHVIAHRWLMNANFTQYKNAA